MLYRQVQNTHLCIFWYINTKTITYSLCWHMGVQRLVGMSPALECSQAEEKCVNAAGTQVPLPSGVWQSLCALSCSWKVCLSLGMVEQSCSLGFLYLWPGSSSGPKDLFVGELLLLESCSCLFTSTTVPGRLCVSVTHQLSHPGCASGSWLLPKPFAIFFLTTWCW